MTSHSHVKTMDGNIACIKLNNNNIFKYTTPMFIIDPFMLENFIEVVDLRNYIPKYLKIHTPDDVLESVEKAVAESYIYSNNTIHGFYNMSLSNIENKSFVFNKFNDELDKINDACPYDKKKLKNFKNEL